MSPGFPNPIARPAGDTLPRTHETQASSSDDTVVSAAVGAASAQPAPQAWMSDLQPADPAPRFDPSIAHPARVYSYWLGGKDHYPADRRAAEEVIRSRPQVVAGARANRAFLARVVRYLAAECGIRQFLDLGTGLPAPGSTDEIAQAIAPDARIVYADNDPLVLIHARALLTGTGRTGHERCDYIDADVRDTATILSGAARALDFAQPIAVLMLALLHFIPFSDRFKINMSMTCGFTSWTCSRRECRAARVPAA